MNTSFSGITSEVPAQSQRAYVLDDTDRRRLSARWTVTAELELRTAAQIGSQEGVYTDQTFERTDAGFPLLRGSTLCGALQSFVRDYLDGYRSQKPAAASPVEDLFGTLEYENPHESRVLVFDSVAVVRTPNPKEGFATSIRDGVRINPVTGLAVAGFKYDRELLLPSANFYFPIRLDVVVPTGEAEAELLSTVAKALEGLTDTDSGIRLGARRSRGLGECYACHFRARRYDLETEQGWLDFASSEYGTQPRQGFSQVASIKKNDTPLAALQAAWPQFPALTQEDQRRFIALRFDLNVCSTILIRTPPGDPQEADMMHLTEGGRPLLSGTTLASVFVRQTRRILHTLHWPDHEIEKYLRSLFGALPEKQVDSGIPLASRVWVSEPCLFGSRKYRQQRVMIDRFTGGAMELALFDQEPCVGGSVSFLVVVRQAASLRPDMATDEKDLLLMLLAGRDLLENFVTIGGEASVGRGIVRGTLRIITYGPESRNREYLLNSDTGVPDGAQAHEINTLLASHLPLRNPVPESTA